MTAQGREGNYKVKYRPYLIAMALAFVLTMIVAPERMEEDSMSPTIEEGQVVALMKMDYSEKRGAPERDQIVVLDKLVTEEWREQAGYRNDNLIGRVAGLPGETISDGEMLGDYPGPVTLTGNQIWLLQDSWPFDGEEGDYNGPYLDSRTMGPVELTDIRGRARWIVWPLTEIGGIK